MGAPQAWSSASSGLQVAATNEVGTGVQLNGDGLDPAHGLVAAERVVSQQAAAAQVASAT